MYKLDRCLELTEELKEIDESLKEVEERAKSPKNQLITGMPRGGQSRNKSDDYLTEKERLEDKKQQMIDEKEHLWNEIIDKLFENQIKVEYSHLLKLRFYDGNQWSKCVELMANKYPKGHWNANKVFRVYREVLRKIH